MIHTFKNDSIFINTNLCKFKSRQPHYIPTFFRTDFLGENVGKFEPDSTETLVNPFPVLQIIFITFLGSIFHQK